MSALEVQLVRDHRMGEHQIQIYRRGFGGVIIDRLPDNMLYALRPSSVPATLNELGRLFGPVYDYCRPQGSKKLIIMSFDHAVATANFLKEIV
ncbi:hypothetical protein phiIBB-PF7Ap08A [Pseudomonas phage phiIBB-PF7A]|uniref:Uncharacterized protein n=1 Tax=Pseudomonas phage phiIBB-PF7A TaxID=942165 RepID=E9KIE4_9CAUD|nr:hypothetical protein phiIBB-PF7Ap08A [Pseudomonas phage phiIBB-PF7A]ADV35669.1 hypothetical protein phiIBB-PF7Ap08A [Pseudomonas phage phiIBB-PF7A]